MGRLVLEAKTLALTETVITAHRPVYKLKGNTLITSIPHTLLSTVGTAGDVLKHIPGVRLSEDSYSVFGKGTPLIYIDSHLIQNPSELDKLSSEEIEKVELITNPGAEYDATVKAVIRIKTIHRNSNGLSVDARSSLNYNNRFIYEGGNPLLTPETIHDVSLMALYRWLQVSVSYKYQKNVLAFATRDHEPNLDVVIFSIDNFKKKQVISSYISLTPHFGWWKPEFGIYFSKPFFQTNSMGETITLNDPNAYFSWNNSLELPTGIVLSLDMDYQTRGNAGAMYLHPTGGVDVGIRKSFLNDALSINLQGRDLFASRQSSFMLYGSRLTYSKRSFIDSRQLSLTLRYKFNATATGYKGKRVSDKDIQRL